MDRIVYFDRYLNRECEEKIYGERALRWTYESMLGKAALAAVVRRTWFSRWYGWRMNRPASTSLIAPFIKDFALDADEFTLRPDQFENFNQFFSRRLKPIARPIDERPNTLVFPADGRHLCIPDLSASKGLFVKGQTFDVRSLVDNDSLAERFAGGSLLLSRLCPIDYHRFHFPFAGIPADARLVNGPLYSVNPIALAENIQILTQNKRVVTEVQTETVGSYLTIEVGATCVGSIRQTYEPAAAIAKGDEKGYFQFGGSSTITIFQPGRIRFDDDLVQHSSEHRELYARMGDHMGVAI